MRFIWIPLCDAHQFHFCNRRDKVRRIRHRCWIFSWFNRWHRIRPSPYSSSNVLVTPYTSNPLVSRLNCGLSSSLFLVWIVQHWKRCSIVSTRFKRQLSMKMTVRPSFHRITDVHILITLYVRFMMSWLHFQTNNTRSIKVRYSSLRTNVLNFNLLWSLPNKTIRNIRYDSTRPRHLSTLEQFFTNWFSVQTSVAVF